MSIKKIVTVSGGFDPIHVGHVRMIQEAAALGDELVVIINNDNWLTKKKGHVFMPQDQRKEIIEALASVDRVVFTSHEPDCDDMSVCDTLREVGPHIFANGGDRFSDNIPEAILCREHGIETVFNVGRGGKVQSSSWLTAEDRDEKECFCGSGKKYIECHRNL
jgi:D-beta-D-heptose 7-phosphate kinase/D-beta-D-heptose 1-phosphate adenosyltransferase